MNTTTNIPIMYPLPPSEILARVQGLALARLTVAGTSTHPVLTIEFGDMMEDKEYPFSICSHGMPLWSRSLEDSREASLENIASLLQVGVVAATSSGEDDDLLLEFASHEWLRFANTPGYEAFTIFDGERAHYV